MSTENYANAVRRGLIPDPDEMPDPDGMNTAEYAKAVRRGNIQNRDGPNNSVGSKVKMFQRMINSRSGGRRRTRRTRQRRTRRRRTRRR